MIYFFTKGRRSGGSSRHRAFNWADFLNKKGVTAKVIMPPVYQSNTSHSKARLNYLKAIFSLRHHDIAILQTTIFNPLFIILIYIAKFLLRPTIIFDFDDAIYINNPKATKALTTLADKIIVASHALAKWPYLKSKPLLVMSNLVDIELAEKHTHQHLPTQKPVLGWSGGAPESLPNLKLLKPIFKQLIANEVKFKFKIVGTLGNQDVESLFKNISGLDVDLVDKLDWPKTGEIQKSNTSFDIGLNPLLDNEGNRARCPLKVIDYMAVGLPVVASDVGENRNHIKDQITGYLVNTVDQWVKTLIKLIENHELRQQIGQAGQARVREHYSYPARIDEYIKFIKS